MHRISVFIQRVHVKVEDDVGAMAVQLTVEMIPEVNAGVLVD